MTAFQSSRNATEGRAYFDRRRAQSKTSMEAMRAQKRRLSNIVYRCMVDDAIARTAFGLGRLAVRHVRCRGERVMTRHEASPSLLDF